MTQKMPSSIIISFVLTITIIMTNQVLCDPLPDAEHVCNRTMAVRKDKLVDIPVSYTLKYQGMCGILPCEKTRIETRLDSRLTPSIEEIQVIACCPGYAETPARRCAPICLNSCNSGKCIAPNTCKCNPEPTISSPGYVGPTCSRFTCLSANKWGEQCDRECNCTGNSYCNASTGKCVCRAGFRGADCSEVCHPSSMNCEEAFLPPIIEPEANAIHTGENIMGASQKLESARSMELSDDVLRSPSSFAAAHMELNVFLVVLSLFLIGTLIYYRKRMNQLRNELYYRSSSSGGNTENNYSSPSSVGYYSNPISMVGRPPIPTPEQSELLSKNLSFAAATRNILTKGGIIASKQDDNRSKVVLHPAIEQRLINSQEPSESNLYSEVDSKSSIDQYAKPFAGGYGPPEYNSRANEDKYPLYQVPKPSNIRTNFKPEVEEQNDDDNESNIYEELPPQSKK